MSLGDMGVGGGRGGETLLMRVWFCLSECHHGKSDVGHLQVEEILW